MIYRNILVERNERVATIIINRPEKLNALNIQIFEEFKDLFTELNNDETVRVIILTGSGEKAFAAGADISELNKLDVISAKEFAEKGQLVLSLIGNMDKPVIAAVNGFALGGGCELAMACHFRVASENAKFGQPEVTLGVIPGFGGTQLLTHLVNPGRAMELLVTGGMIDANEALRIGLINHIYQQDELIPKTIEIANKIASNAPIAVKNVLKAVNKANDVTLRNGMQFEAVLFALCCGTTDFKEGTSAFLEKRKPDFKNK
jgi:enoyl-CoA hydratase